MTREKNIQQSGFPCGHPPYTAERTGSPVLHTLWSYVLGSLKSWVISEQEIWCSQHWGHGMSYKGQLEDRGTFREESLCCTQSGPFLR
ncbi:hypothetical protein N7470_009904 [Penicillium chermesinum]|nr:hypothetical protein N7470_009904 [Penicillium chermesinum]